MEEWAEKFGWKKVTAILIVASLLIIIYVIFSMLQINKPVKTSSDQKASSASSNSNSGGSSGSDASPISSSNFKKYSAKQFNFSYPESFKVTEINNAATKDDTINLKNAQNVDIFLHFYPASTTVSSITQPFIDLGYDTQDFQVGNFPAKIYSGKFGVNPERQEQVVVFVGEKGDTGESIVFGALLDYPGTARNSDIESAFQQIVKSINF